LQLVDTNILAYLLIAGDRTAAAQELYSRDGDWRSEAFVLVEFSNMLCTYRRSRALTMAQAVDLLASAQALMPVLSNVEHAFALEIAAQFELSAYDARFIALAKQMKTRLVTEDGKLQAAAPAWTISLEGAITKI
jgi:predicted nucleic acid-binding protein